MGLLDWLFGRAKMDDLDHLAARVKNLSPEAILEHLAEQRDKWESTQVRLGFVGEVGTGKSSLINAFLGRPDAVTEPVPVPHALDGEEHQHNGVVLVDLPGCGAPDRPRKTYLTDLKLLERGRYDGFILVTGDKLKEDDVWLFEELHRNGKKPLFVVRNKFDNAVKGVGDAETARRKIETHYRTYLKSDSEYPIFMVSAHHPQLYDLPKLLQAVCDSLPGLKRGRILAVIPAYTEKLLEQKRNVAEKIVLLYAALAGGNGVNPIPGLNVAVDLGLVQVMTRQVIECYGLRREQLEALARLGLSDATLDVMLQAANPVLARLVEEGMMALLQQAGGQVVAQEITAAAVEQAGKATVKATGKQLGKQAGKKAVEQADQAGGKTGW